MQKYDIFTENANTFFLDDCVASLNSAQPFWRGQSSQRQNSFTSGYLDAFMLQNVRQ
jgi:hypothetical protein